jgi:hypothetical protein
VRNFIVELAAPAEALPTCWAMTGMSVVHVPPEAAVDVSTL